MAQNPAGAGWWAVNWHLVSLVGGCLIAVALGAADHFLAHDAWSVGVDLSLIWAGLGGLGVTATVAATR